MIESQVVQRCSFSWISFQCTEYIKYIRFLLQTALQVS